MNRVITITTLCCLAVPLFAQRAPIAANPLVEIRGTITRVQLAQGQGAPYLEVMDNQTPVKVYLGSMRYLIEQDFNPKVRQQVLIRGYRLPDAVVAASITTTDDNREVKLRDENGWPVWREAQRGGRQRQ